MTPRTIGEFIGVAMGNSPAWDDNSINLSQGC
jgi:hypothetical protein